MKKFKYLSVLVLLFLLGCSSEPDDSMLETSPQNLKIQQTPDEGTEVLKFNDQFDLQVDYSVSDNGYVDLQYELIASSSESKFGFLDFRGVQLGYLDNIPSTYSFVGLFDEYDGVGSTTEVFDTDVSDSLSSRNGMVGPDYMCECNDVDLHENIVNEPSDCLTRTGNGMTHYYCDGVIKCTYCSVILILASQEDINIGDLKSSDFQSGVLFFNP